MTANYVVVLSIKIYCLQNKTAEFNVKALVQKFWFELWYLLLVIPLDYNTMPVIHVQSFNDILMSTAWVNRAH